MDTLPMFPLGSALLPGNPLPLQIFEPRYLTMLRDVAGGDRRFGVVLIERGFEVGGGDERFSIGTVATIEQLQPTADGRVRLLARGGDRFEVARWLPEDPYPRAEVRTLPALEWSSEQLSHLAETERTVRRALVVMSEYRADLPPSDVELIRPMAMEYNRTREALRNHRIANTPGMVTAKGVFPEETMNKLTLHAPHEVIEAEIGKNDDIHKLLREKPVVQIQPALYSTEEIFLDTQRVVGAQTADFGGTAGASATEVAIADGSRVSTLQSNVDDLDEFLTDVMRNAGQVLFLEMAPETAKMIAGPGGVWPEISREDVAKELVLSVKAGSSGRPNRAARMAAIEKMGPLLMQIPGIKPRKMGEFMVAELDENIDIDDFFDEKLPSMVAMNAQSGPNQSGVAPGPATAPAGAMNAAAPQQSPAKTQNVYPSTADAGPTIQ